MPPSPSPSPPPARVRILGQLMCATVARFPASWPIFRPYTERFFDRIAPDWHTRISAPERMAPLERALERAALTQPRRILDLGTGTGAGAIWLAERFPEASIAGADISARMIEVGRAEIPEALRDRVELTVADASALPFGDGEFDLVTQISAPAFFAGTARVLASGAHLAVVSSLGPATPAHTPPKLLRRGFEREGLEWIDEGAAGRGTWYLMRRPT